MSDETSHTTRRTALKVTGGTLGSIVIAGGTIVRSVGASDPHPDDDLMQKGWAAGQTTRQIPDGPAVGLDVGGSEYSWETVCSDYSREYAEAVMEYHPMWYRFNDVDSVEGNVEAHQWTWVRDKLNPFGDYSIAGIQLWERGNPLNPLNNLDGKDEVEDDPKYDAILCKNAGDSETTIEKAWRGSCPDDQG